MESNKMKLSAGILNLGKEIEIYDWIALVAPEYGSKPFNKRFETWLNKKSSERFGYHTLENWGLNHESKDFENVRFSFRKQDWGDKFEINFYYEGQKVGYDYDAKAAVIQKSNEREGFVSVESVEDVANHAKAASANRTSEREKAQGNLKYIAKLMAQRDSLQTQIREHNDKISYILSDELRIR